MVDSLPLPAPIEPRRVEGTAVPSAKSSKSPSEGGPAFKALLEDLERRARDLEGQSASVSGPEELAGAVDRARESLEDVLSLKDRLLEAFQQSRRQGGGPARP